MQNNVQTINGVTWFDSLEERNAFLKQNGRHEFALEEASKNPQQNFKLLDFIEAKIPYEVKKCNSCGGRIQKLFYKPVIVVETETKK